MFSFSLFYQRLFLCHANMLIFFFLHSPYIWCFILITDIRYFFLHFIFLFSFFSSIFFRFHYWWILCFRAHYMIFFTDWWLFLHQMRVPFWYLFDYFLRPPMIIFFLLLSSFSINIFFARNMPRYWGVDYIEALIIHFIFRFHMDTRVMPRSFFSMRALMLMRHWCVMWGGGGGEQKRVGGREGSRERCKERSASGGGGGVWEGKRRGVQQRGKECVQEC